MRVGGNATLACPDLPPGAGPPRHLLWWKEDRRLIEATRDRVTVAPDAGPRVSLLPGSSALVFRSVLAQDSGEYQCVVNNRQGRRGLVRLFVQGEQPVRNSEAPIYSESQSRTFVGESPFRSFALSPPGRDCNSIVYSLNRVVGIPISDLGALRRQVATPQLSNHSLSESSFLSFAPPPLGGGCSSLFYNTFRLSGSPFDSIDPSPFYFSFVIL